MDEELFFPDDHQIFIENIYFIGDYIPPEPHKANWYHNLEPSRDFYTFTYILSGEAMLCPGDKKLHVFPGDIVYIPAGYPYYSYGIKAPFCWIMFCFKGHVKKGLFRDIIHDESNFFKKIFEELNQCCKSQKPGYQLHAKSIIYNCLKELYLHNLQSDFSDLKKEMISKAHQYIEENIENSALSVNELINFCGVSDTYFRQTFKEIHNMSPIKYINKTRIEKSKEFLLKSDMTINDIALKVGFINIHYYSTVFKQLVGESPLNYRKRYATSKSSPNI